MTDVVNRSSADESEEKQRTLVKTLREHCIHLKIFNMKSGCCEKIQLSLILVLGLDQLSALYAKINVA